MFHKEVNDVLCVIIHLATEGFSGSKYPTSNLFYPHIANVKKVLGQLLNSKNPSFRVMADAMLDKLSYWGPDCTLLFAVAAVLDPRFKMGMIKFTFPSLYSEIDQPEKLASVESILDELYALYEIEYNKSMSTLKNNESNSQCTSTSVGTSSSFFSVASQFQELMKAQNATHPSKPDLRKYFDDPVEVIPPDKFDIL